jgi:uncharacterized DUF497 family protein
MKITYDPAKNNKNIDERGLPFDLVENLDWNSAIIIEDARKNYGERRFKVLGLIGERLYMVVFTPRNDAVHVISFRKANIREVKEHGKHQA